MIKKFGILILSIALFGNANAHFTSNGAGAYLPKCCPLSLDALSKWGSWLLCGAGCHLYDKEAGYDKAYKAWEKLYDKQNASFLADMTQRLKVVTTQMKCTHCNRPEIYRAKDVVNILYRMLVVMRRLDCCKFELSKMGQSSDFIPSSEDTCGDYLGRFLRSQGVNLSKQDGAGNTPLSVVVEASSPVKQSLLTLFNAAGVDVGNEHARVKRD